MSTYDNSAAAQYAALGAAPHVPAAASRADAPAHQASVHLAGLEALGRRSYADIAVQVGPRADAALQSSYRTR